MPTCIRCHKPMDDTPFCPYCGAKQERRRGVKARGNGMGCAYKRGKTWTITVTVGYRTDTDGKKYRLTRSRGGFKTKSEALAAAAGLRQSKKSALSGITLLGLYDKWKDEYEERIEKSTMNSYRSAFAHFKPIWYRSFVDLAPADWQDCMDQCDRGKRTLELMRTVASLLYRFAMHNELVTVNKALTLYTGNGQKLSRPPISFRDLSRIRAAVDTEPYAWYVVFLCYTGFRPGEFLKLKKSDFDLASGHLVGGSKTKAGKNRHVPVVGFLLPFLSCQMQLPGPWLFPRLETGRKMDDKTFRVKCFQPLMDRLGIRDVVPYSCRHTFANLLKRVDGSDTDKAAIIGHADASMTKYYQEADFESLEQIVHAIEEVSLFSTHF